MSASDDPVRDGPDEQEPLEELFGTVFDLAGQVASRISPDEIEARLRRTLQEEGHRPGTPASTSRRIRGERSGQPGHNSWCAG